MTTSFREGQYAPGVIQPDPICQRIHIPDDATYTLGGAPGRRHTVPQWSPRQVIQLTAISPAIQARINKLIADSNGTSVWNLESRPKDGIHVSATFAVLDKLATQTDSEPEEIKNIASEVSKCCNVLWFYEVIPTRFPSSARWAVYDSATTRNIIGAANLPPPLRQVTTHDTHHSHLSWTTIGDASWCWSEPSSPYPYETALELANCALILDWEEVFKRAIKIVIWETKPADAVLLTPVKHLKLAGLDGINSTSNLGFLFLLPNNYMFPLTHQTAERREEEKERVLSYLLRCLTSRRKTDSTNVDKTIKVLSNHGIEVGDMPDQFAQPSIYQLLRDIQTALVPTQPPTPSASEPGKRTHARKPTHGSSKSSSSSGSHQSAPGTTRDGGPHRHDTNMTSGSSKPNKSNGIKRQSGSGAGASSSTSSGLPSSPPPHRSLNRPLGPSLTPLFEKFDSKLGSLLSSSNDRRESRTEAAPDLAGWGPAAYMEFVHKMLQEMQIFVLKRQAAVAEEILARRDSEFERWGERLL